MNRQSLKSTLFSNPTDSHSYHSKILNLCGYYSSITKTSSSDVIMDEYFNPSIEIYKNEKQDKLLGKLYFRFAEFQDHCFNNMINNIKSSEYQELYNNCV